MSLEENIRICRLIDIYGKLLTENQLKVLKYITILTIDSTII